MAHSATSWEKIIIVVEVNEEFSSIDGDQESVRVENVTEDDWTDR